MLGLEGKNVHDIAKRVNIFLTRIFHFPLKNNAVNRRKK